MFIFNIIKSIHDFDVGVLPTLVHDNQVKVVGIRSLKLGTLLQVLDHVLLDVHGAHRVQGPSPPGAVSDT